MVVDCAGGLGEMEAEEPIADERQVGDEDGSREGVMRLRGQRSVNRRVQQVLVGRGC